ncbi:MAG: hypothetical protein JWQ97_177 [Phenylobacterium sp.]|nr:hypothetical protein [Phenylobacterium sp.]
MRNLIAPAALIAGLVLSSGALAAPAADSSRPVVQEQDTGRMSMIGAPIGVVTASKPVSYTGLNLANPADVHKLHREIAATARRDCRALRAQYPPDFYPKVSGGSCVRGAERRADASVAPAITAASSLGR